MLGKGRQGPCMCKAEGVRACGRITSVANLSLFPLLPCLVQEFVQMSDNGRVNKWASTGSLRSKAKELMGCCRSLSEAMAQVGTSGVPTLGVSDVVEPDPRVCSSALPAAVRGKSGERAEEGPAPSSKQRLIHRPSLCSLPAARGRALADPQPGPSTPADTCPPPPPLCTQDLLSMLNLYAEPDAMGNPKLSNQIWALRHAGGLGHLPGAC